MDIRHSDKRGLVMSTQKALRVTIFTSHASGAQYRLNPKGAYALYRSGSVWKESTTPNSWLLSRKGDYSRHKEKIG